MPDHQALIDTVLVDVGNMDLSLDGVTKMVQDPDFLKLGLLWGNFLSFLGAPMVT